jgi:hypothetical protein
MDADAQLALVADPLVEELRSLILARSQDRNPGPFQVLRCVYETRNVAILKNRKIYRLSNEVDFKRVMVITIDYDRWSYGPLYVAVPEKAPEINVTRSVAQEMLQDVGAIAVSFQRSFDGC